MPQPRGRLNPTSTITDEQRAEVARLHGEGKGRNEIATAVGISAGSVTAIVKKLGLSFDRTATAAATAARQTDLRARRVRIIERMYDRMEHLQDRLEAKEFKTLTKGAGGSEHVTLLDFVPTVDERNVADTISRYQFAASKLEAVDADDRSAPAVDQWLEAMTGGS